MNSLYLAFSVVFPLLCMLALGYFLKLIKIFNDDFLKQLNNLCFKTFIPLLLFLNVYKSDFHTTFSIKLVVFSVACVVISFIALMVIVPIFQKDNERRGVIVQGIFRSNYILFGIPITASLFGDSGVSATAILIAFVIPTFNALSVVALETFASKKVDVLKILKNVLKNPLIISAAIAFAFILTDIKLPILLEKTISDISKIATPLALIILGGSFAFSGVRKNFKTVLISVLGKLVIIPLIFIPISIMFGFRNLELVSLLALFASPTAVSSYTMSESIGGDSELAGQIVVIDSTLSVITIFIFITVLKQLALI